LTGIHSDSFCFHISYLPALSSMLTLLLRRGYLWDDIVPGVL
jgi:hypothetical protein